MPAKEDVGVFKGATGGAEFEDRKGCKALSMSKGATGGAEFKDIPPTSPYHPAEMREVVGDSDQSDTDEEEEGGLGGGFWGGGARKRVEGSRRTRAAYHGRGCG